MSMTNHPSQSSSSSQMLKSRDCRARDIKRRLDIIQKKMTDLQELGVPCAFCYVSRNTGSLFTSGTQGMTAIIQQSRDEILDNLSSAETDTVVAAQAGGSTDNQMDSMPPCCDKTVVHMVLPPLSQPLADLSLHELRSLIVGIIKDLGIKWSDNKPPFWPAYIPFQYPRTAPDGFQGSWTKALREIVQSMYNYFDYNSNTYHKQPTTHVTSHVIEKQTWPQNCFLPEPSSSDKGTDHSDDEDGEEIDVGVSYTATQTPQHIVPLSPLTSSINEQDDDDEIDTISICSDTTHEPPQQSTINYFGYEIARSDSSPITIDNHHQSDREISPHPVTPTIPSSRPHPVIQTPQLLYCSPQLYSQLYPVTMAAQTTPFLIQPNLQLLKKRFIYTSRTQEDTNAQLTKDGIKNPSLTIPYTLPARPLQISSLNMQSSTPPITSLPYHNPHPPTTVSINKDTSLHNNSDSSIISPPSIPITAPNSQQETFKNRKGRNQGIYIYTTPSEPLKFMSLNSKINHKGLGKNDKKLVAMAPVAPPIGTNGEAVISLNDSAKYRVHPQQTKPLTTENIAVHNQVISNPLQKKPTYSAGNITSKNTPNSRKPNGSMKRKRELVFHWYHSPENQPGTSPPSSKRLNTTAAGTV